MRSSLNPVGPDDKVLDTPTPKGFVNSQSQVMIQQQWGSALICHSSCAVWFNISH